MIKSRSEQSIPINTKEDIEFLVIDWFECDIKNEDNEEKGVYYYNKTNPYKYTLFAFGVTKEGNSVCLKINNYRPYYYIQVPEQVDGIKFDETCRQDLFNGLMNADPVEVSKSDISMCFPRKETVNRNFKEN